MTHISPARFRLLMRRHGWTIKQKQPARILLGKMLVRPVKGLDLDAPPVVKSVYLDLSAIEWQIRDIMKREGCKGIAMLPISAEDEK